VIARAVADRIAPGVHQIPEDDYFAARYALSASGAKDLLDCPARFRWKQDHPTVKGEFDYGSAAHKLILGSGPQIAIIDADSWRTNAAKDAREQARQAGHIPLLIADFIKVQAMAAALQAHPLAAALFDPDCGLPEQSLFWHDAEFGIDRRARLDWLPDPRGGRLIIGDYKTTTDASPGACERAVGNWAYHVQRAWYCEAVRACGLDDDPAFLFCFQEKDPPYLINVVQLDAAAITSGDIACRAACEIFRDCTAADSWPGYPWEPDITEISVSPWKTRIPEGYYQ
jgi:hypothetical protein